MSRIVGIQNMCGQYDYSLIIRSWHPKNITFKLRVTSEMVVSITENIIDQNIV